MGQGFVYGTLGINLSGLRNYYLIIDFVYTHFLNTYALFFDFIFNCDYQISDFRYWKLQKDIENKMARVSAV